MSEHSTKKQPQRASPSRRGFSKTTLAGALLASAIPMSGAQAEKASKSAAKYQVKPRNNSNPDSPYELPI